MALLRRLAPNWIGWACWPFTGLTQQRDEKSHMILSNVLKCLSNRQILTSRFLPIFLVEKREGKISEFFNKNKEVCKSLCYLTPLCWVRPSFVLNTAIAFREGVYLRARHYEKIILVCSFFAGESLAPSSQLSRVACASTLDTRSEWCWE